MKTARFWVYSGSGWVKLGLRDGESLSLSEGGPNEEGYSYTHKIWEREGDVIFRRIYTNSRDCDGRLDTNYEQKCPVGHLKDRPPHDEEPGVMILDWREVDYYQRDYSAEAMGY